MNEEPSTNTERGGEITIDSDRTTTFGAALLFIACGLLLAREIRGSFQGRFIAPEHLPKSFFSIFINVSRVATAVCLFTFAFRFPRRSVRLACVLMGTGMACNIALSWLHVSLSTRHTLAVAGSGVLQIALVIFLVTIAEWFRSKVRWISPSQTRAGER